MRYKGAGPGRSGSEAEWLGTHHEPIAKYPSFYTGRGLARGTTVGDEGWNADSCEHAYYQRKQEEDGGIGEASAGPGESSGSPPPGIIGSRKHFRKDGMSLRQTSIEVGSALAPRALAPPPAPPHSTTRRAVRPTADWQWPPQVKHQYIKLPGTATGVSLGGYKARPSEGASTPSSRAGSPSPSVK